MPSIPKIRICAVTGSRAEYGIISPLLQALQSAPDFELLLIVTGAHLSREFGSTSTVIEEDGFRIDEKVEMLLSSDSPVGMAKSMGLGVLGIADTLQRLQPDMVLITGDRYEMLAAASVALLMRIPIAHLFGGDTTEGAVDEAIRHGITKMSNIHLVSNELAAQRLRQMGEASEHIHVVGSPSIDNIRLTQLLDRRTIEEHLGYKFKKHNALVTFHPVTLATDMGCSEFKALLEALSNLGDDFGCIFTRPNADASGRHFAGLLDDFIASQPQCAVFSSLGQRMYFSVLAQVDMMIGNSSSGFYEAPSFKRPTVNIGGRQRGRLAADSILQVQANASEIEAAIHKALSMDCSQTGNPYGDGHSIEKIIAVLRQRHCREELLQKHFHLLT